MKILRILLNNLLVIAVIAAGVMAIRVWWGNPNANSELPISLPQDRAQGRQGEALQYKQLELLVSEARLIASSSIPDSVSLSYSADQSNHSHYLIVDISARNLSDIPTAFEYYGANARVQLMLGIKYPFPNLVTALHPRDATKITSNKILNNEPISANETHSGSVVFALPSKQRDYSFIVVGAEWQTMSLPSFEIALSDLATN